MSKARKINLYGERKEVSYDGREGIVYARVSSKRQETEGTGLKSQEGRCLTDLQNIKVPHAETFRDSVTGGGDFMNRPAMRAMLEYIDTRPHKKFVVVFDDLKRFARDVEFHLKLRTAFEMRDVALRCLNYNFDDSDEGRFAELIMAGQAELERKQNKRQVIQKQRARLLLGYWAFGSKKGYKMTRSPIHGTISMRKEPEATYLQEALEGYAKSVFLRKVDACRFLVDKGFWKAQAPERYIDKFTVILRDPFYAGFIEYPAWEVSIREGKHEGLISKEIFELNQKRLTNEATGRKVRMDVRADFPMRGLLVCPECRGHLTGAWSKGRTRRYAYYKCQNKDCERYSKSLSVEDAELRFNQLLKRHKLNPRAGPLIKKIFDKSWDIEVSLLKERELKNSQASQEIDEKIKLLSRRVIETKSESLVQVYEKEIEDLVSQREQEDPNILEVVDFDIPYGTALDKATGMLKSPYKIWAKLEVEERQKLFFFIFDEKLPYSLDEGYGTAEIPSAVRLFEDFVTTKSLDVEMGGIEPPCE